MDSFKILAINPGSTSTKVALYENETELHKKNVEHPAEEIAKYKVITDQSELRKKAVQTFLDEIQFSAGDLSAIVARGGALPPIEAGAYRINEKMVDYLKNRPRADHASNVAALIAFDMANSFGIPSFIYDGVSVDQIEDIARISGFPEIVRRPMFHPLNTRAMAKKYAQSQNKQYADVTVIVAHLGGGVSISIHHKGRIADALPDDEGAFSPERAGGIPGMQLIDLCYSVKYTCDEMKKCIRGKGGLVAYLGTNSALEVEKRIAEGDKYAEMIYQAMAYQIANKIGELTPVAKGRIDAIIITGGIAHSKMLTGWVSERVAFIAPVVLMPGENEMEALALGALRVLRGEEEAHHFDI